MRCLDILKVSEVASTAEIRSAYLKQAKQYHPDVNKTREAQKMFAEINEAHETLKDDAKRKIYDQTGMSSNEQEGQQGAYGFNPFSFAFGRTKAAY